MKKFLIIGSISLLLAITSCRPCNSSYSELKKISIKIEGMGTACCVPKVEKELLKVKGVKKVSACFKRGIAKVEIESGKVTTEQLIKAVKIAGFKAKVEEMEEK